MKGRLPVSERLTRGATFGNGWVSRPRSTASTGSMPLGYVRPVP